MKTEHFLILISFMFIRTLKNLFSVVSFASFAVKSVWLNAECLFLIRVNSRAFVAKDFCFG
jgi:hypothetical protein